MTTFRQITNTEEGVGRDLWRVIDDIRAAEGVSLNEMDRRCGLQQGTTQHRRKRATAVSMRHAAAMLKSLGWELRLAAKKQ